MKVLHIIDNAGLGGAQSVVKGIFESQKENDEIYLYILRNSSTDTKIDHPNVIKNKSYKKFSLKPILELKRIIKNKKIDCLHCHLVRSFFIGWLLKKLYFPKIKLIIHEQTGIPKERSSLIQKIFPFFCDFTRRKVNLFIAISNPVKNQLIRRANIPKKKIKKLYNFVDLNKFNRKNIKWSVEKEREKLGIKKDEFVAGIASRLIKRKGWKEFILAAEKIVKQEKKIKFLIAGDGQDKEELLKLIKYKGLEKNVIYLGYISNMVWFYSLLNCFVIPSHWEPMGITELEAQGMGIPVISSDVPALNEIINDKKDGFLFKAKDSRDLAKKIKTIQDNKLRKKLIKNGYINVKNYSLINYIKKMNEVYKEL